MKRDNLTHSGRQGIILVSAFIIAGLTVSLYAKTADVTLLIQPSPLQGGTITPNPGVHYFQRNTALTLNAVPKPGYQFVCWLGDVGDATSNSTLLYLNDPKIIIAVFERVEYEYLSAGASISSGGGDSVGTGHSVFAGGSAAQPGRGGHPRKPKPTPIPEPITALLLSLGSIIMLRRKY